jgi:hypothetical protein
MVSGRVPCAFDSLTRRILPPRLTRPFIRSVMLLNATLSAGAGATAGPAVAAADWIPPGRRGLWAPRPREAPPRVCLVNLPTGLPGQFD